MYYDKQIYVDNSHIPILYCRYYSRLLNWYYFWYSGKSISLLLKKKKMHFLLYSTWCTKVQIFYETISVNLNFFPPHKYKYYTFIVHICYVCV